MKPLQIPPLDPSQSTLSTFFSNPDFRKLYNKLLDTAKQWKNMEALIWFLGQCLTHKVVPESSVPKTSKPPKSSPKSVLENWSKTNFQLSLDLIEIAHSGEKKREKELREKVMSKYNILYNLTPNDYVKGELEARFVLKCQTFQDIAMNMRIKKLNFLSLKQKSESAIKVLNSPSTEQVAADANNEDQNNSADEGLDNEPKATTPTFEVHRVEGSKNL